MLDPYHNAFRNLIELFDLGSPRSSSKVYEGVTSNAMKWYLAIMSVIVTLLGMASVMPAALSVMVFDAPGSTSNRVSLIAIFHASPVRLPRWSARATCRSSRCAILKTTRG